jgi:DNA-binding IclR family transcriptional regulator
MRAVLRSLRDHPHDDTTAQVASHARLAIAETESLLDTLAEEHLVLHADRHWQLSRRGWSVAREVPERPAPT